MNLSDVRIGDRCWTGYCETVNDKGQNATVVDKDDVALYLKRDDGYLAWFTPGASVFWSRPAFPEKPHRMVKREVKGWAWESEVHPGYWELFAGTQRPRSDYRPAALIIDEEEE